MNTIADKLEYLEDTKTAIGNAIVAKGGSVTGKTFRQYATEISNLPSGGGGTKIAVSPDVSEYTGGSSFTLGKVITAVNFPSGITALGERAFYNCTGLTSITIPDSVTSIGNYAFQYCTGLTSVNIPDSVTSIGTQAFQYCTSLTSVTIPSSVTSIDLSVFDGCKGLTNITIPDSVTSIGMNAFRGCSSLTSVTIPDSITSIATNTFRLCTSLASVTIPDSVTSIDSNAFGQCIFADSNFINNSSATGSPWGATIYQNAVETQDGLIIQNGDTAVYCRKNATSVTIPDSVTSINDMVFKDCTSLISATIGNGVTSIGYDVFSGCTSLTSVTIPSSVTSIGNSAFYYCNHLTSFTCEATTPPTLGSNVFNGTNNFLIYVPAESVSSYKSASGWSSYASRIQAIPDSN